MSRHDATITLRQMLDHSREAVAFLRGKSVEDLRRDRLLNLALVRILEIIGEAAGRISAQERARHAEIPWSDIVSLRNRLIHGYDSVDLSIVWQTVRDDLPALIESLEEIVRNETGDDLRPH